MKDTIKEFKTFVLRGNVVDLAIAVVIGAAFGAVVTALVKDLITPILAIPGKTDFSSLKFTIRKSDFLYGDFINTIISFLSIAAAVFFLVVKPVNRPPGPAQDRARRAVDDPRLPILPLVDPHRRQPVRLLHRRRLRRLIEPHPV